MHLRFSSLYWLICQTPQYMIRRIFVDVEDDDWIELVRYHKIKLDYSSKYFFDGIVLVEDGSDRDSMRRMSAI